MNLTIPEELDSYEQFITNTKSKIPETAYNAVINPARKNPKAWFEANIQNPLNDEMIWKGYRFGEKGFTQGMINPLQGGLGGLALGATLGGTLSKENKKRNALLAGLGLGAAGAGIPYLLNKNYADNLLKSKAFTDEMAPVLFGTTLKNQLTNLIP